MAGEQIRLLIVEDVPQVASHVRSLLQAQSQIKMLAVVTAGDRAVASVGEVRPDVVIVDALLQGRVTGQQVAEQIRQAEPQVGIVGPQERLSCSRWNSSALTLVTSGPRLAR